MSRIAACFERHANENKKVLVIYIVGGDPNSAVTVELMHRMVASGAGLIELGVPFTDPEADGPVIQYAAQRALAANTTLQDVLAMVSKFRERDDETPVVLMGYLNPVEKMGYERFAGAADQAGVDGTIIVNAPPEENELLDRCLLARGIDPVYLLAPTTSDARAKLIFSRGRGFAYYVSLKGTTGASTLNVAEVQARLAALREFASLPIAVGFGIKSGEQAAAVARFADGVAIGAAVVEIMEKHQSQPGVIPARVGEFIAGIRAAMDADGS